MSDDNIERDVHILNKSSLRVINKIREMWLESISKGFSNYFVHDVAKTYGSKVLRSNRLNFLGDKNYESLVDFRLHESISIKVGYQAMDVGGDPRPGSLIERCVEAVGSWGSIASHFFNDAVKLLEGRR
jgi:hypothetical protein